MIQGLVVLVLGLRQVFLVGAFFGAKNGHVLVHRHDVAGLDQACIQPFVPFTLLLRGVDDVLVQGQLRLLRGMDLATRNLRVVVRRIDFLLRDGQARPYLADLMEQIEAATLLLREGLDEPGLQGQALDAYLAIIHQLDPKQFGIADQLREASVLLLLRPLLIDLLCAAGMGEEEARAELPAI